MNHLVIEGFLLCEEGGHAKTIERLTMERAVLCDELARYISRFGKLTVESKPNTDISKTSPVTAPANRIDRNPQHQPG
jgi:hypothetical protein